MSRTYNVVSFEISGDLEEVLLAGITIALTEHGKVSSYFLADDGKTLVLCWGNHAKGSFPLPFPMSDAKTITKFVWDWLHQPDAEWPDPDDYFDGSTHNGFRLHRLDHCSNYDVIRISRHINLYHK